MRFDRFDDQYEDRRKSNLYIYLGHIYDYDLNEEIIYFAYYTFKHIEYCQYIRYFIVDNDEVLKVFLNAEVGTIFRLYDFKFYDYLRDNELCFSDISIHLPF